MIENRITGLDVTNMPVWEAKQLNEAYGNYWIGTGREELLTMFQNAEAVIEFYVYRYTKTDSIAAMINDAYYLEVLSTVALKTRTELLIERLHLSEST